MRAQKEIAEQLSMSYQWVMKHIPEDFKREYLHTVENRQEDVNSDEPQSPIPEATG